MIPLLGIVKLNESRLNRAIYSVPLLGFESSFYNENQWQIGSDNGRFYQMC
jgi:hypothetical protein